MKVVLAGTTLLLFSMLVLPASPQDQDKGHQADVETKFRVFFSQLETQWLKAAQAKDQAALNRIVSDNFQLWTSAPPGKPVPREEWLLELFGRRLLSFQLRQLSVRQLSPEIAVVSFVQSDEYQQSATPQTEEHFVVDVWINKGSGDNWRCTDRYVSEVVAPPAKK